MKRLVSVVLPAVLVAGLARSQTPAQPPSPAPAPLQGRITISGAWALYPMAARWSEEFRKINPGVRIDLSAGGAGKGVTDILSGVADIGLVSRDLAQPEKDKGAVAVAVTRDAVVPVISARNPVRAELLRKGVPRDRLTKIWIGGETPTWGALAGTSEKKALHVYTRSDACGAAETFALYLGGKQENLKGVGVYGDPQIADAVRRDPLGLGYNNLNFAYDPKTQKPVEGLEILPLDLDNNGTVDPRESFYATRASLVEAITRGVYPAPPARDLFFVCRGAPAGLTRTFVLWVLSDGQKFVDDAGYVRLPEEQIRRERERLQPSP